MLWTKTFERRRFRDFTFPEVEKYPVPGYSPIVRAITRGNTPIEGLVRRSMEAGAVLGSAGEARFSGKKLLNRAGKIWSFDYSGIYRYMIEGSIDVASTIS